jgi:hypothetical protein
MRRDTIVTVLALLVIAFALPIAIVDTFKTGRMYVFSRQFLEELPRRAWTLTFHAATDCSGCSSVLDVVESCCEAAWRPSATWSPWGSSWTSYFN